MTDKKKNKKTHIIVKSIHLSLRSKSKKETYFERNKPAGIYYLLTPKMY